MLRKFRVKINQKEYLVEMEEIGAQPSVAPQPQPTIAPQPSQQHAVEPKPSVQPSVTSNAEVTPVVAPMPGTILDVRVSVGQEVSEDQVLVILEAMKMENEIVAPQAGVITEVAVRKNDSIDVGSVIVKIG